MSAQHHANAFLLRGGLGAALPAALLLAFACRAPTEIKVTVTTDPALCGASVETVIGAGSPGAVPPVAESSARVVGCPDDATSGKIGSIVLLPSNGDRGAKVEVRVVRGISLPADQCEAAHFAGCVVARRMLRFVAHQPLDLPIALDAACVGVDCPSGTSCTFGACYPYDPDAPGYCADPAHAACVAVDAGADVIAAPKPCPSARGPSMVRVDTGSASFCIDATEVTDTQFTQFATAKFFPVMPPECAGIGSFSPQGTDNLPAASVNWCDAYAFCAWAGKRLCKNRDGSSPSGADASVGTSEWYLACSRGGAQAYPYGAGPYDPERCKTVGAVAPDSDRRDVGAYPACVGGYPGIFDLVGGVHEWVDGCEGDAGPKDTCAQQGGSFDHTDPNEFRCDAAFFASRISVFRDVGFRCCAD